MRRCAFAAVAAAAGCPTTPGSSAASAAAGRLYGFAAYLALNRDRARYANLPALRRSTTLTAIAERHSVYMAGIGNWSDGDPEGDILARVRAAGLNATYAGQNVVTATAETVPAAIQQGERFFANEAGTGGPHWENITNPNHRFNGTALAVVGGPGNYTIYLTQVFADLGGCTPAGSDTYSAAASLARQPRIGATAHPQVDALQLRSEPNGQVIGTLHAADSLKILDLQNGWAQVKVLSTATYGWVFAALIGA